MFQTRQENGAICQWDTFAEALEFSRNHLDVWKISFAVGGESIRLVKTYRESGNWEWTYESIEGRRI